MYYRRTGSRIGTATEAGGPGRDGAACPAELKSRRSGTNVGETVDVAALRLRRRPPFTPSTNGAAVGAQPRGRRRGRCMRGVSPTPGVYSQCRSYAARGRRVAYSARREWHSRYDRAVNPFGGARRSARLRTSINAVAVGASGRRERLPLSAPGDADNTYILARACPAARKAADISVPCRSGANDAETRRAADRHQSCVAAPQRRPPR